MIWSLLIPIVATAVALFFASFLSWMVLGLHAADWRKLNGEDTVLSALRQVEAPAGSYMLPGFTTPAEQQSPEYVKKFEQGPVAVVTVFPRVSMGRNLALTFVYFLVTSFCLAYLATLALPAGASFFAVFRFLATASFMVFLSGLVCHAVWFHCRIVGHVVESVAYAAIVGAIFASMWPAA
jgi:hypothetical protein